MTDKQIIIDGKKEKVNILFECNHIEDIEAFDMIKQGIEITPQNAPVGDFKIKIISNIHSPYGFSSICSKSKKSEDWEYMGFGHSGACSVTTALLKALQRKEQEYEELRQYHNKCCKEFENEKQALLEKYNQVSINFYNGDYCNTEHCSLLKAKEQECGELKRKVELMMDCPDCKVDEYKKALEEIERYINNQGIDNKWNMRIQRFRSGILDIINKAKGEIMEIT